jgi:hypothetical protein
VGDKIVSRGLMTSLHKGDVWCGGERTGRMVCVCVRGVLSFWIYSVHTEYCTVGIAYFDLLLCVYIYICMYVCMYSFLRNLGPYITC